MQYLEFFFIYMGNPNSSCSEKHTLKSSKQKTHGWCGEGIRVSCSSTYRESGLELGVWDTGKCYLGLVIVTEGSSAHLPASTGWCKENTVRTWSDSAVFFCILV